MEHLVTTYKPDSGSPVNLKCKYGIVKAVFTKNGTVFHAVWDKGWRLQ